MDYGSRIIATAVVCVLFTELFRNNWSAVTRCARKRFGDDHHAQSRAHGTARYLTHGRAATVLRPPLAVVVKCRRVSFLARTYYNFVYFIITNARLTTHTVGSVSNAISPPVYP